MSAELSELLTCLALREADAEREADRLCALAEQRGTDALMVVRLHDEARRFRELAADLGALSAMAPELLAEQLKAIGR
jgi:hypothetical protein